ncbi:MAG: DUF1501 domain-containing protein [Proteobacteria bacterium]|nr:DUF1501 domain-containing protein [Pseudomonadota bacterium]
MLTRRLMLHATGCGLVAAGLPSAVFAAAETDKRLVVIILRGAMDGLSAAPAYGDPDFERARNGLALPPPGQAGGVLKLDAMFGLHPNLVGLKSLYDAGEMTVVHACATPYRDRSHFDGQNLLENGSENPNGLETGWLNRALAQIPGTGKPLGVALDSHMPLVLRGPAPVTSWAPSLLPSPDYDTVQRVAMLYGETDPVLARDFALAQGANSVAAGTGAAGYQAFVQLMTAAARFLSTPDGERIAMVDIGGWDTHVNQAGAFSPLSTNLRTLDHGIAALRQGLGPIWRDTVVIAVSEFGRTVAMNGTQGTDHGTGSAVFLAGGAIRGGQVVADWPGLKPANLYQNRDLRPTTDFRSIATGVLRDHMGLRANQLAAVFPSSAPIHPKDGLIRA